MLEKQWPGQNKYSTGQARLEGADMIFIIVMTHSDPAIFPLLPTTTRLQHQGEGREREWPLWVYFQVVM